MKTKFNLKIKNILLTLVSMIFTFILMFILLKLVHFFIDYLFLYQENNNLNELRKIVYGLFIFDIILFVFFLKIIKKGNKNGNKYCRN